MTKKIIGKCNNYYETEIVLFNNFCPILINTFIQYNLHAFLSLKGLQLHGYFHKILANMSSGLLQVLVKLREPTQNFKLCPLLNPRRSPVLIPLAITRYKPLSIPVLLLACSKDWTSNLQMIVSLEAKETNANNRY